MATQNETPIVSPAPTYCSELEYLIALQTEELAGSQPRRSQRLRERKQTAKEDSLLLTDATAGGGSPQLFTATDDEFSQLAQLPPNRVISSNSFKKRAPGKTPTPDTENTEAKKRRSQTPTRRKRGRPKKQPKAIQMATTTHSEPLPGKLRLQSQLALDSQHSAQLQLLPAELPPSSQSRSFTPSGNRRRRIKKEPEAVPMQLNMPYETQNINSYLQESSYAGPEKGESNSKRVNNELQRVSCGTPANESGEMSRTPIAGREMYSPSPPNAESLGSKTPSLSESLAEVFGTKILRDVLNIATPRIYRLHEAHLPAIAFMLGVEVGRLRSVLELTQRLSLEQLQQLAQESLELISVNSSSEEETDFGAV
ncbi:meiotic recombination protein P22 [Drosophila montana]|uniref:meiotic recombination protein P22 n=1 Tax=Drosophila montana TaxID=40370 RepID=UPI00313CD8BD